MSLPIRKSPRLTGYVKTANCSLLTTTLPLFTAEMRKMRDAMREETRIFTFSTPNVLMCSITPAIRCADADGKAKAGRELKRISRSVRTELFLNLYRIVSL